jgi:hypothetical protein
MDSGGRNFLVTPGSAVDQPDLNAAGAGAPVALV